MIHGRYVGWAESRSWRSISFACATEARRALGCDAGRSAGVGDGERNPMFTLPPDRAIRPREEFAALAAKKK